MVESSDSNSDRCRGYFLAILRITVIARCLSDFVDRSLKCLRRSFSSDDAYGSDGSATACGCVGVKNTVSGTFRAFAILCMMTACGGGSGAAAVGGDAVIPTTTKVLEDSSTTKIASISSDQTTITFSETTPQIGNLKAGDVLVLGVTPATPEGLLRRVTGVQKNPDGSTTLQTGPASLEDAVEKGSVSYSKEFTVNDVVSEVTTAKGVGKALPLTLDPGEFSLELKDVVLYDRDGKDETKGDQITANGLITFKPSAEFKIAIDSFTLKQFSFSVTGAQSSNLTVKAGVPLPEIDSKKLLKRYNLGTKTFFIGYVPVVVTYELGIYVGMKGEVSLGLAVNSQESLTYTGGVKYENNDWSPINSITADYDFLSPTINASVNAKCFVGPELYTKLYGVAGPYVNTFAYLLLQANPFNVPWWELYAGIEGNAGAKIELLSKKLKVKAEYEVNIFDVKKLLAQASTPKSYSVSGQVTLNGAGLSGVTVTLAGGSSTSTTTDSNGNYTISGVPDGSYTITPSLAGYAFTPANRPVTVSGANATVQDFAASNSGSITVGW